MSDPIDSRPVHTRSLIVSWTHEYVDMLRDMLRPSALIERLKHLWIPPEWEREAATPARQPG